MSSHISTVGVLRTVVLLSTTVVFALLVLVHPASANTYTRYSTSPSEQNRTSINNRTLYLDQIKVTQDKLAKLRKELEGYRTNWKNGSSSDSRGTSTKKERGHGEGDLEKSSDDDRRMDLKKRGCSVPGSDATTTCGKYNYTIDDVVSVVYESLHNKKKRNTSTMARYVVTLENGKHRTFVVKETPVAPYSERLTKVVKMTGYEGDLEDLFEKAVQKPAKVGKKFALTDVKSITSSEVDPLPEAVDDEYTEYTITLNDGRVVTVKGHAGRGTVEVRQSSFRKAGYTGDVDALIALATEGAVLGASTTSLERALTEASVALDELATLLKIE